MYRSRDVELPGFFRLTEEWDPLVVRNRPLLVALEVKSQAGSFGNNFNNRTEEAMGSALDLWTAYCRMAPRYLKAENTDLFSPTRLLFEKLAAEPAGLVKEDHALYGVWPAKKRLEQGLRRDAFQGTSEPGARRT